MGAKQTLHILHSLRASLTLLSSVLSLFSSLAIGGSEGYPLCPRSHSELELAQADCKAQASCSTTPPLHKLFMEFRLQKST